MKFPNLLTTWWGLYVIVVAEIAMIVGGFWVMSLGLPPALRTRREAIEPTVHEWTAGSLKIIDLRSGTEINRIIIGPDGQMIAERLYINWEGEQEVRRIGSR